MVHKLGKFVCLFLITILLLTGCGAVQPARKGKLKVVTTLFATYDFARQVGGDRLEVTMLLPPGVDSHVYEPTPKDIAKLKNCDVLIYVGGESDAWLRKIIASLDNKQLKEVRLLDIIHPVREVVKEGMTIKHAGEAAEEDVDEHVWTSPVQAMTIVDTLGKVLGQLEPANQQYYQERSASYQAELQQMDQDYKAIVAGGRRKTLIFGDRFPLRYFVEAYGLDYYAAFPGCAQNTEPSAATVAFLINKIRQEHIPVVLHIELSNRKIAQALSEATGAQVRQFNTGHNVTKEEFDRGITYLDLLAANGQVLKEALE